MLHECVHFDGKLRKGVMIMANEVLDDSVNVRMTSKKKKKFVALCNKLNTNPSAMVTRMITALEDNRLTIEPTKEEKELTNVNRK